MLIKALCDYYDVLATNGKVLRDGYSRVDIHYIICLTPEGKIGSIISNPRKKIITFDKRGKEKETSIPSKMEMPKRTEVPGICANIPEHRPLYIFGLNYEKPKLTTEDKTNKAKKSNEEFKKKNLEFLDGLDSPVINAYRNFILSWDSETETENEHLLALEGEYPKSGYAFCLESNPEMMLHDDVGLQRKWELKCASSSSNSIIAQCAVTGMKLPISRIHNKIKGLGNATGNVLVNFNSEAEESYGCEQSYNSKISEAAMKKYTEAMNYLVSDRSHHSKLDEITSIFWASSGDPVAESYISGLAFNDGMGAEETEKLLMTLEKDIRNGEITHDRLNAISGIDTDTYFYIVGLKPNVARISVKYVYSRTFGKLFISAAQHQEDIKIRDGAKPVSLWQIKRELTIPKSTNKEVDSALITKILEAIIYGYNYPEALFSNIIRRIKNDSDGEGESFIKMNDVRIGILKGYINRKLRLSGQKEEIKLSLDKQNTNPAYLCGRLFAVLESIQQRASGYNLNRTIKDAYFSSASSRPAVVFPKLIRLSTYHMAKLDNPKYYNEDIKEIINLLGNDFPEALSLTEQGKFIIGYYQQCNDTDIKIKKAQEAKKNELE